MLLVKSDWDDCLIFVMCYLHTVLRKNIYSHLQSYSDKNLHVVNLNDIIFTRERENSDAYYQVTLVKVCSDRWIQVTRHWKRFTAGRICNVHVNCIQCDSACKRRIPNYIDENIALNLESLGAPGGIARFI